MRAEWHVVKWGFYFRTFASLCFYCNNGYKILLCKQQNKPAAVLSDSHFHLEVRLRLIDERLVLRNGQVDLAEELFGNAQRFAPAVEGHPLALRAALDRAVRPCLPFFGFLAGVHAPESEKTNTQTAAIANSNSPYECQSICSLAVSSAWTKIANQPNLAPGGYGMYCTQYYVVVSYRNLRRFQLYSSACPASLVCMVVGR